MASIHSCNCSAETCVFSMPPSRAHVASDLFVEVSETLPSATIKRARSGAISGQRDSWHMYPSLMKDERITTEDGFEQVELHGDDTSELDRAWDTIDNLAEIGLTFTEDHEQQTDVDLTPARLRFPLDGYSDEIKTTQTQKPFGRWVENLHKKASRRRPISREVLVSDNSSHIRGEYHSISERQHKKSASSSSSMGLIKAVKSASTSIATLSVAPRSRFAGRSSNVFRSSERGSALTNPRTRASEDSYLPGRGLVNDQEVTMRSVQRRRVLEEIISTEESYLGDIKFLKNVYGTFLASIPTLSLSIRKSITRNLDHIIELHEDILGELHRVVPHSEYSQKDFEMPSKPPMTSQHTRWHSLDSVPECTDHRIWLQNIPGAVAEPKTASAVAQIFNKNVHRFFAYEEYGAKYELMVKDVASCCRTWPQWEHYQTGLEALAVSLASINSQSVHARRSMTVGDLLVKPIQRACKYPLLFTQLLKETPVCDCPESHTEIDKVLLRFREVTAKINQATDDPLTRVVLEKTWRLQDRLAYPTTLDSFQKTSTRTLGHIQLCGVLYAAWQTNGGAEGRYMVSLLYRNSLILATAGKVGQVYLIQARIALKDIRIEEADNKRGLQCHTVPFSWKIVFECDYQLYEIILSACSWKEETEWRARLNHTAPLWPSIHDQFLYSSLFFEICSLGAVFGKAGTVARRISMRRAMTVGTKSQLYQIIIRNTAQKSIGHNHTQNPISRSQSLLTIDRVPVFSPARTDRMRLEALLSDVWTKDVLPYPGMNGRTAENLGRVSERAHSVMRKLSVASFASSFARKPTTQKSRLGEQDSPGHPISEPLCHELQNNELGDVFDQKICVESTTQLNSDDKNDEKNDVESLQDYRLGPPMSRSVGNDQVIQRDFTPTPSLVPVSLSRLRTLKYKASWTSVTGLSPRKFRKQATVRPSFPLSTSLRTSSSNTIRKRNPNHEQGCFPALEKDLQAVGEHGAYRYLDHKYGGHGYPSGSDESNEAKLLGFGSLGVEKDEVLVDGRDEEYLERVAGKGIWRWVNKENTNDLGSFLAARIHGRV